MRINRLTASFGKLENETLQLHDGLNIICSPNESGKTTWCAFIQAMLYGVDTSERSRAGLLADKTRYIPWSGAPMEGTMDLTADRCDITLTRTTTVKNAPMKEFRAVYTGTSEAVDGLTGQNAGQELTGVTRDVFRRSAFISQGNVAVTGSPELEKRILSIVSTGEEHSSYSEADERLRSWQRRRRYNSKGILPDLERSLEEDRRRLAELEQCRQEASELNAQLQAEKAACAQLEKDLNTNRKQQRKDALDRLNAGKASLNASSAAHDEASAEVARRKQQLSQTCFGLRPLEKVETETAADLARIRELTGTINARNPALPFLLLFLLAIAGAALYTAFDSLVYVLAAAVFCIAACALLFLYVRKKNHIAAAAEEQSALLRRYQAEDTQDILDQLEEFRALYAAAAEAFQRERQLYREYQAALDSHSQTESEVLSQLDFSAGSSLSASLASDLSAARQNVLAITERLAELNARISLLGDPTALKSNISLLSEQHSAVEEEYAAISLALKTLKEADTELQTRFAPRLGAVAAGYMSVMTDGKYTELMINRDFSAMARAAGDAVARDSAYLSTGTTDLLYLAVRLAVCELAMPKGETCPLIIDDALVNLDEARYEAAIRLLKEIARERQVILFTCRS
ncbi:MAG: AAA family ATPase [Oscillospiraceae bacterium]|nr:AAA family ATPase [Oscillospiraceae bacterium]